MIRFIRSLSYLLTGIVLFPVSLFGQGNSQEKLSPYTRHFLSAYKERPYNRTDPATLARTYAVRETGGQVYINVFIESDGDCMWQTLTKYGVRLHTITDRIATAQVPVDSIEVIAAADGIRRLQIGTPVREEMDSARRFTRMDEVLQGTGLPGPYKGKNVVIGIIDNGFEYGHINFYTPGRDSLRIKRVWNQLNASGTPPDGFSYGSEYKTASELLAVRYDDKTETHGTHVAGIAAGGDTASIYSGVAPEADLVLVSLNKKSADNVAIIDGIKYICDYAASVNKPCVINLSLGSFMGPHDGTSVFDRLCDDLQGAGRLLVGAAGNEARNKLHLSAAVSATDTLKSFFTPYGFMDIWGEPDKDYKMKVVIFSAVDHTIVYSTDEISASSGHVYSYRLNSENDGASGEIKIASERNPDNGKANIYLESWLLSVDSGHYVGLMIWGDPGTVHVWGDKETIFSGQETAGWTDGNNRYTVNEIGGTGKRIISVGAYVSKNEYTNTSDETIHTGTTVGDIAEFSSIGPAADGRMKPDITAPGAAVVSSFSSVVAIKPAQKAAIVSETLVGRTKYYYGVMNGTSMAAPQVTGILATWLEADPGLTPEEVREILSETAVRDSFTGETENNTWGYGKIDAWQGLKEVLSRETGIRRMESSRNGGGIYPNPGNGNFSLLFGDDDTHVHVSVVSVNGQLIHRSFFPQIRAGRLADFSLENLSGGIYIVSVKGDRYNRRYRLLVR